MKRLLEERGDAYFEFLICLILAVTFISLSLQIFSAVKLKLWVDARISTVMRNVQVNGSITEDAEFLLDEVSEKIGVSCHVEWDTEFFDDSRKIQLGKSIRLRVSGEVPILKIGKGEAITVNITSEVVGTSEIYWKTS